MNKQSEYKPLPILLLPDHREMIDRAARENGERPSQFIRRSALEAAKQQLGGCSQEKAQEKFVPHSLATRLDQ